MQMGTPNHCSHLSLLLDSLGIVHGHQRGKEWRSGPQMKPHHSSSLLPAQSIMERLFTLHKEIRGKALGLGVGVHFSWL